MERSAVALQDSQPSERPGARPYSLRRRPTVHRGSPDILRPATAADDGAELDGAAEVEGPFLGGPRLDIQPLAAPPSCEVAKPALEEVVGGESCDQAYPGFQAICRGARKDRRRRNSACVRENPRDRVRNFQNQNTQFSGYAGAAMVVQEAIDSTAPIRHDLVAPPERPRRHIDGGTRRRAERRAHNLLASGEGKIATTARPGGRALRRTHGERKDAKWV